MALFRTAVRGPWFATAWGGVNGGNIASSVACDAICKAITENYTPDMEEDAVRDIMLHAINDANAAVLHRAQEDPALNGMGTTVVVSIAAGGVLHLPTQATAAAT